MIHAIRAQQGSNSGPAMNTFDQEVGTMNASDFKNTTQWPITYWHKGGTSQPMDVSVGMVSPQLASGTNNCPSFFSGFSGMMQPGGDVEMLASLAAAKQAWIDIAHVYSALLDGGSTPALVQQVQASWPQDAWALRAQLLGKSPYLSTEVLVEVMKKNILPQAMVLEICLANPEATKKEGFVQWASDEAPNPLPGHMIDLIAGSWDEKTLRMELEAQMGQHHADMTLAADMLRSAYRADTTTIPVDDMLAVWQELPSYGARYGELTLHLRAGRHTHARNLLNGLDALHPMDGGRTGERDRALWYVDRLEALHQAGRTELELDSAEVAEWRAFALAGNDIPGGWVRNVLCLVYNVCLPHEGGAEGGNKTLRPVKPEAAAEDAAPLLRLMPNPAVAVVAMAVDVPGGIRGGHLRILDMAGREVVRLPVTATPQQVVWDTRQQPAGAYQVELHGNGTRLATERLVVQPR